MAKENNPHAHIATVARRYLHVRETSRNRGPEISKFWDATWYPTGDENREPWCVATVDFLIQEADKESEEFELIRPPRMASVKEFLEWARSEDSGCTVFKPGDETKPRLGDIAIYLPRLSHIGIISADYANNGFIRAIEGNTNQEGSREGDGVYEKQRRYNYPGYFVRLPVKQRPRA
jgi:hypothetical protein